MRTMFKHDYPKQKEFENIHASTLQTLTRVKTVEENPVWHSGENEPSDAVGKNKDFYLDTSTGNIFQKENGTWV